MAATIAASFTTAENCNCSNLHLDDNSYNKQTVNFTNIIRYSPLHMAVSPCSGDENDNWENGTLTLWLGIKSLVIKVF